MLIKSWNLQLLVAQEKKWDLRLAGEFSLKLNLTLASKTSRRGFSILTFEIPSRYNCNNLLYLFNHQIPQIIPSFEQGLTHCAWLMYDSIFSNFGIFYTDIYWSEVSSKLKFSQAERFYRKRDEWRHQYDSYRIKVDSS